MREGWVTAMYEKIKQERDARLAQALSILRRKAADDQDIEAVLALLEPWVPANAKNTENTQGKITSGRAAPPETPPPEEQPPETRQPWRPPPQG